MSGFDFDALRDPDAPLPGGRERAGVETRARQLRSRARRNRLVMSATAIVATTAIVLGVVAATHSTGPSISVESPSTTTASSTPITSGVSAIQDRFVPPTRFEEDSVVLPVTFPDGETVTLRYPTPLKIAQLGFAGFGGVVGFSGDSSRQVALSYTTMDKAYAGTTPSKVFPGSQGQEVRLYAGKAPTLAFQFGPWLVKVSDGDNPMSDSQLATWARNLTGSLDPNGYLILHAAAPLSISHVAWFDGGFGAFGEGNLLELALHIACNQPESDTSAHRRYSDSTGDHVSWCDGDLHVTASGAASFVDMADKELQVSALATPLVSETTSTTTTTRPAASSPAGAVSATWVSPDHGWALDKSGLVWETTDGGTNWVERSRVEVSADFNARIRFADALHGFEFNAQSDTPLESTTDGGVHWTQLKTPFSRISDLAITRGIAYVVGIPATASPNSAFPGFRIWSTPTAKLDWTMDPLVIPVGAGPVPEQTLVFAGDRGWMVNNDRVVVSGARLSPTTGRWSEWNPPCKDAGGPAELAASTSADLVALCPPGFASSSPTTYVEFSHDGGDTFQRQILPGGKFGAGGPLSPSPNAAVIADGDNFRRTIDDGATWRIVATGVSAATIDFGFTTTTQGFVILQDGRMLMTHDAGATWSQVTRP